MNVLRPTLWFLANLVWNAFLTLVVMLCVYACISWNVPGEAAAIGLVDVSDTPLWWSLGIAQVAFWSISWLVGWGKLLTQVPWDAVFIGWWLTS